MGRSRVIPLFDYNAAAFTKPPGIAEHAKPLHTRKNVVEEMLLRPMMLAYRTGDRCIRCGNGGFHIGRSVATCSNQTCQLPVPLG